MSSFARYRRTVRLLPAAQIAHRLRLRGQREVLARLPALGESLHVPRPTRWGWPDGYVPIDGRLPVDSVIGDAIGEGRFTFLNEERSLGTPPDWQQADALRLWRFHLHYFEWSWQLAGHPDREWAAKVFERLWRSWRADNPVGRWDAWSPYVASLRAWALCAVHPALSAGQPVEDDVLRSLAQHAGYLRWNLERDVGGNHLVKNLKALLGLGAFLGRPDLVDRALRELLAQLPVQVLADGGHYERSPSYHAMVLGDLLDCRDLLLELGRGSTELDAAVDSMREWLSMVLAPDGEVPLFNDSQRVGADRLGLLGVDRAPSSPLVVLQPSGYVVLRPDERLHLVMDVGPPCPPELPAHAHADSLTFELSVDGLRSIVDTGTSTYQLQPRRQLERGTSAHNTVELDGEDSTEVWGAFRAGRRADVVLEECTDRPQLHVVASHDGYRHLRGRPTVRRSIRGEPGRIHLIDEVVGRGRHQVVSRFHLHPEASVHRVSPYELVVDSWRMRASHEIHLSSGLIAGGFGVTVETQIAAITFTAWLPVQVTVDLVLSDP